MNDQSSLFRIAYASKRACGVNDDEVIEDIVLPAITKNRGQNITGCLWFDKRRFLQVIEGEEDVVRALFRTIEVDVRHIDVELLSAHAVDRRVFPRFSMRSLRADAPAAVVELLLGGEIAPAADRFKPDDLSRLAEQVIVELSEWAAKPGADPGLRASV